MELPTLRQLECLVAVAQKLNFRQAAELCFITQPALSAQILQLEAQLGLRLFERDRRRVLATPAGARLAEKAGRIIDDLRGFVESTSEFKQPLAGTLRLGVIPTVAPYLLPQASREIHARYPDLDLFLEEAKTDDLLERLGEGALDLVLVAVEPTLDAFVTMPLHNDEFVLAVPAGHGLADRSTLEESDLHDEQLLLLDDGHCLRDQALAVCSSAGACEYGDFRASSLTTLIQMVAGGTGATLLPRLSCKSDVTSDPRFRLISFGQGGPARMLGLAWRRSSVRQQEFELIGEAIRSAIA